MATDEQEELSRREYNKKWLRVVKESRAQRYFWIGANFVGFYLYNFLTKEGWERLKDPDYKNFVFNKEGRTGLLMDSIFENPLYVPDKDNISLEKLQNVAGRWVGYDFRRKSEFGQRAQRGMKGRLTAFPLEEIIGNAPEEHTPTRLVEPLYFPHFLQLTTPTIQELLDWGLAEVTTYEQAYEKAGLGERFGSVLATEGIADKSVYRVTPKGNGLILLLKDQGDRGKKPALEHAFKPSWAF